MIYLISQHLLHAFEWYWGGVSLVLWICWLLLCGYCQIDEDDVFIGLLISMIWPIVLGFLLVLTPFLLIYHFGGWLRDIQDLRNQPPLNEHPTAIRVCKECLAKFPHGTFGQWVGSCPHEAKPTSKSS
jgi:hypothetical protein